MSEKNIWKCWFLFRKGKRPTRDIDVFQYGLEGNLALLRGDLLSGAYRHGGYHRFSVFDNKRREISVACVRDRVVHRLIYEYLNAIYDKTFLFDVWSCRKGKGLLGAIERTQSFLRKYPKHFVWRADVRKFFDSVDHDVLVSILERKVRDQRTLDLLREVIGSFSLSPGVGIPIGNLTSQIFSNIYLNEFDRFVAHTLKPSAYLRYGDDFLLFCDDRGKLIRFREEAKPFLSDRLHLVLHPKNDILIPVRCGVKFLGVEMFPKGRRLKPRNRRRVAHRLTMANVASYAGLIAKHESSRYRKQFEWTLFDKFFNDDVSGTDLTIEEHL